MQIRRRSPNPAISVSSMCYQVAVPDAAPRHILEEIVWHKEIEVEQMRERLSLAQLRRQVEEAPAPRNFIDALRHRHSQAEQPWERAGPAVIAEVKKASPSKGVIREDFDPVAIATAYLQGGATCLSVLTDSKFFQGSFENLASVSSSVNLPVLCKDFVIYPYQIYMARSKGADAVLLIAAILNDKDLQYFIKITNALKMTPLIEVHTVSELDRVLALEGVSLVGINNRNLEDFSVDLQITCQLLAARGCQMQERGITVVSESGLHAPEHLRLVASAGADAVLIGESLVKQPDPASALAKLFL